MVARAYSIGIFPMASRRSDRFVHWVAPTMRGVLPLPTFHVPRRLRRTLRADPFDIRCDKDFERVVLACAALLGAALLTGLMACGAGMARSKPVPLPGEAFTVEATHPWEAIVDHAKTQSCDLIVMASHGRGGVRGLLLGSETNKVLTHSDIPVLVLR